ncbi:MAG: PilN domain-containing protein [Candidatus Omnitrophota bacterium]|nr:PilN domain-containing protein [Candidatus Omnitrophota bacterium]
MDKKDILIIPRHQVTLRFIELPSLDPSEIRDMVEFQALKELPYPKEEVITGYRNIGSYKKGFSCIMLAIVKRQFLEEIMAKKSAKPESIRLETEILYLYLLKKNLIKQDKVTLVIDIQRDHSELLILDKTKPVFSRGLTNTEAWLEEVDRSVISYRRDRNNREIEEVFVASGLNLNIDNIKPHLKEYFTVPVNFYEYKEDMTGVDLPLEIDILPGEYMDKKLSMENTRQAVVTYFLLFVAVVMLASFFVFKSREKDEALLVISEKVEGMQGDIEQLDALLKKTEILKGQQEEGGRVVNILKECYDLTPQDITLGGLDYDPAGILYCKGMTREMSGVFNFVKALEKSKYFKKVEVKYATKKKTENQEFTDFNIACFTH